MAAEAEPEGASCGRQDRNRPATPRRFRRQRGENGTIDDFAPFFVVSGIEGRIEGGASKAELMRSYRRAAESRESRRWAELPPS